MRQSARVLIATAVTVIVVAACGGGAASQPPTNSQPVVPASQPSGTAFSIGATDLAFDLKAVKVPADGEVTVTLTNKGVVEHDFVVDALGVKIYARPGETVSGTLTAKAGTYEFYCSIAGHKQAGMVGTLTAS